MEITRHRCVVAGLGEDGRSRVVSDGSVEAQALGPISIAQPWVGSIACRTDNASAEGRSGVPFRFEQLSEPVYGFMIAEYAPGLGRDDPGMHFTDTADHFYVLEGEVVLVLEQEEVVLRAGDCGVCRGVTHGWRNLSDTPARLITFVLPATRAVREEPSS